MTFDPAKCNSVPPCEDCQARASALPSLGGSAPREQEQQHDEGWTKKGQPQEPGPSRDATVFLISVQRRGKDGTERRYIMAPDGSPVHTDVESVYPLMRAAILAGWKKAVCEELIAKGDHFVLGGTIILTPPERGAKGSLAGAPVPAVDPSRSTPDATLPSEGARP